MRAQLADDVEMDAQCSERGGLPRRGSRRQTWRVTAQFGAAAAAAAAPDAHHASPLVCDMGDGRVLS